MAVPTVNNVVTGGSNGSTSHTLSAYTPTSGSDTKLMVMHGDESSVGADPDTIKFDGTDLTKIASDSEGNQHCSLWYLDSPGTSAGDIVLQFPATFSKTAAAWTLVGV